MSKKKFNEILKSLRILRDKSQNELAKHLYVSQQTVAKWETDRSTPNPETLSKIADFLECSVDYLVGRTDTPQPNNNIQLVHSQPNRYDELNQLGKDKTDAYIEDLLKIPAYTSADGEATTESISDFEWNYLYPYTLKLNIGNAEPLFATTGLAETIYLILKYPIHKNKLNHILQERQFLYYIVILFLWLYYNSDYSESQYIFRNFPKYY